MLCGIYCLHNLINNKEYVGQSVDIHRRFREHCFAAKRATAKDYNSPIHLAMHKYGIENFELLILELCPKDLLNEREQFWIMKRNSYNQGYNASLGGDAPKYKSGTPVEVYDLDGNYITEYPSITIAADKIGVSRNTLYGILFGDRLSAKGFQFKIKNSDTQISAYHSRQGGAISVEQLDLNGNVVRVWNSATQAMKEAGFDASTITKCCKGKLKTHKGYSWRYTNENSWLQS